MKLPSFFTRNQTFFAIIILVIISLPPRLWNLSKTPPLIIDEPAHIRNIDNISATKNYYPATPMWDASQATLSYYPTIALIKLGIKDEYFALRLATTIFSILTLIPFFFIVKKYTNTLIAYCITLLFSYSYYYLQFSRVGWLNIYGVGLGLTLYLLLENAVERFASWKFFIAGVILGILAYLYRAAEVYMVAVSLVFVKLFFVKKPLKEKVLRVLIYLSTGFIIAFPWLQTVLINWNNYIGRSTEVSIFTTSFPYHGLVNRNSIFIYQLITTIKAWFFLLPVQGGGIEDQRYLPLVYTPVNPIVIVLFWLGFFFALKNFRKTFVWILTYLITLLFGQILTLDPPNGARAFIILPVIYLFSAFPLYYLYQKLSKFRFVAPLFVFIASIMAYSDFVFYQFWMTWIKVWIS